MVLRLLLSILLLFCLEARITLAQSPSKWVNLFIGTTNPRAIVLRAMVSVVPFNVTGNKKLNKHDKDVDWWSTPYSYNNSYLKGYSHVNLSGAGCPELGVILFIPTTGKVNDSLKNTVIKGKEKKSSTLN